MFHRFIGSHLPGAHIGIDADLPVHVTLDQGQFIRRDGLCMADIKAQTIRGHERALLGHMGAQAAAQGGVQQMGGRMVGPQLAAARIAHRHFHRIAHGQGAGGHRATMHMQIAHAFLRIGNLHRQAISAAHCARITLLAAGFSIERRLVDQDRYLRARRCLYSFLAVDDQGQNLALRLVLIIAEEFRGAAALPQFEPDHIRAGPTAAGPTGPRLGPLAFHGRIEAVGIHPAILAAQHILGQIQGKAIGIV